MCSAFFQTSCITYVTKLGQLLFCVCYSVNSLVNTTNTGTIFNVISVIRSEVELESNACWNVLYLNKSFIPNQQVASSLRTWAMHIQFLLNLTINPMVFSNYHYVFSVHIPAFRPSRELVLTAVNNNRSTWEHASLLC